jgi:hypothetical protein
MSLRLSLVEQSPACQAEQGDNIRALSRIITDAALVVGRLQDFARQARPPAESVDVADRGRSHRHRAHGNRRPELITGRRKSRIRNRFLCRPFRLVGPPPRDRNLLLRRDAMPRAGPSTHAAEHQDTRVVLKVLTTAEEFQAAT